MGIEIFLSFIVGAVVAFLLSFVFSLKTKGIFRLVLNMLAGSAAMVVLNLFKIPFFTFSPLSAFLVGLTGMPGIVLIALIGIFF